MSTTRMTDTRDMTEKQADELLQRIFSLKLSILRAEAAAEAEIEAVRQRLENETYDSRSALRAAESNLDRYIHAHRERFEKPKMRPTPWGKYGLRKSTRLRISSVSSLIETAREHGYTDCIEETVKIIKKAVSKRLRDGEKLPGAYLEVGQTAEYKLDAAAIEEQL